MNHLLTTDGLARETIESLLEDASEFAEVLTRPIPKVPALRGKTVATMFFEPSTRMRPGATRSASPNSTP